MNELKLNLQEHMTDGLVVIIGSGMSTAVGLPSMPTLAEELLSCDTSSLPSTSQTNWQTVTDSLKGGADLETSLDQATPDSVLDKFVVQRTADIIRPKEELLLNLVLSGKTDLPIGALLKQLIVTNPSLPVVTTNYDRLIEFAAERASLGVDTSFSGQTIGVFDPRLSHESLGTAHLTSSRKSLKRKYRSHIKLYKPHGSLDWYISEGVPIRCMANLDLPRLMITPGGTKYIKGYDQPFDRHREKANEAIDRAARFLILGFGFNDKELETHLRPSLEGGTPCILLTKSLTPDAESLLRICPSVIALHQDTKGTSLGTTVLHRGRGEFFSDLHIWDLEQLLNEVL